MQPSSFQPSAARAGIQSGFMVRLSRLTIRRPDWAVPTSERHTYRTFTMHKSIRWVLVLLMCVPISAAGPNSNVPVVVSIEDTEGDIAPTLQIRSDGSGVYRNSSVLESIIQSGGD